MINYSFYHFENIEYESAVTALLENLAVKQNKKIRMIVDPDQQQLWDNILWSKKQLSFIPHNTEGEDTFQTKVYLTSKQHCENFSEDATLILKPESLNSISSERILYIIDNKKIEDFKQLFSRLKDSGDKCHYYLFTNNTWVVKDDMRVLQVENICKKIKNHLQ